MNTTRHSPLPHHSFELVQRAMGVAVGSAVGDALGAPFEFGPALAFRRRFPRPVHTGTAEMVGGGPFPWAPGEFTDDTQMALCLAESLLANDGLDPVDLFVRFRAWRRSAVDCGIVTSSALTHDDHTTAAESAHRATGRSASNGALMRTWPIALKFVDADTHTVMSEAVRQAATTHFDPAAGWAAAIASELIRRGLLGRDPIACIDEVVAHVPDEHRARFADMLSPSWTPHRDGDPSNGSAWTCLAQAVWAVRHHRSFEDAVVAAIELGGDTDTVASVTGAIAGARWGIQSIPCRWSTYVHGEFATPDGVSTYDYHRLLNVARNLVGKGDAHLSPTESPAGPTRIDDLGLYVSDLGGALASDPSFATVSLCLTAGRLDHHVIRREVYMRDEEDENLDLGSAVTGAVDSIDALLAAGHRVLVHCHGGRSRTGLVAKAWAMRRYHFTEREAHDWLEERWHRYEDYRRSFVDFLRDEWNRDDQRIVDDSSE